MSSILVETGANIPLSAVLDDQATSKFIRATIFTPGGNNLTQLALAHSSNGVYINNAYPMPAAHDNLNVLYEAFDDAGFTTDSGYDPDLVTINKDKGSSEVASAIQSAVLSSSELKASVEADNATAISITKDSQVAVKADNISSTLKDGIITSTLEDETIVAKVDEDDLQADKVD